jgi:hypothetical protein
MSNEDKRQDFAALTKAVEKLSKPWRIAFFVSNLLWAAVFALLR